LPPDHAEVVLLRVLGDLDAAHVAEVMGRSVSWVRVTQHRALRRLAERVGSRLDVTP
jgi:DNA-directed RNA polymerase specialized sigma24 family protein